MKRRIWALGACLIVLALLVVLAPSLDELRFKPPRPFAFSSDPAQPFTLPNLGIAEDTPIWKILLFWLALVLNLTIVLFLLSPELRKRLLRHLIRFAVGVLGFLLLLRYRILQLPELALAPPAQAPSGIVLGSAPTDVEPLQPPQVAPWVTYLATVVVLWLMFLIVYASYRYWQRYRQRRQSTLGAIADIARTSLADLAAGREWSDVVMQAYARMNDAVQRTRGLQRESSSTPREFAARLARTGLPASSVEELTLLFESVRYGGRASDAGAGRRALACLESILHACGAAS